MEAELGPSNPSGASYLSPLLKEGLVFLSDANQVDTIILLARRKSYSETFVVQN